MTSGHKTMVEAAEAAVGAAVELTNRPRVEVPYNTSGSTLTPRDLVGLTTEVMQSGGSIASSQALAAGIIAAAQSKQEVNSGDVNLILSYAELLFGTFILRNEPTIAAAAIWTSGDENQGRAIRDAVGHLLGEHDLGLVEYSAELSGSWFQRLKVSTRKLLSRPEVKERFAAVELGLQAALVDRQVSENDERKANALKAVAEAFQGVDQAVAVIGQIVVVKHDGMMVARSIDAQRAARIEKSSILLSDPRAVLNLISERASVEDDEESEQVTTARTSALESR